MSAPNQVERPVLLATEAAAAYLGIPAQALLRLRREGKLRGKWVSRGYYFTRAALDAYAEREDESEHTGAAAGQRPEGVRLLGRPGS